MIWQGSVSQVPMGIMLYIQNKLLIFEGYSTYLSHVRDMTVETPTIEKVPMVCEFPNVFLVDLPGL